MFSRVLGQVYVEERRLVVRRHLVGDPDVLQPSASGGADQRTGDRERQPHVPGQRQTQIRRASAQLPAGNVRDHGRVLETSGRGPAQIFRNTFVPSTQKSRLRSGNYVITECNPT